MYKKNELLMFYYHGTSHVEKEIKGVKCYRNETMAEGVWKSLPTPGERLLDHIQLVTKTRTRTELLKRIKIHASSVSRFKGGVIQEIPLDWLVKLSNYSTIPLNRLYVIAGIKPTIQAYDSYLNQ